MSNDTDHEPEDDLIQEHLAGLIELMERNGWKVTGVPAATLALEQWTVYKAAQERGEGQLLREIWRPSM